LTVLQKTARILSMFTSDYSFFDADHYDPFENIKRDETGLYMILENGRKVRFPSPLNMKVEIANQEEDELMETVG